MSYGLDVQSAQGVSQLPGNQPTTFVTLPIAPAEVVLGSIWFNVSTGKFTMGSTVGGTPTWVPIPTNFAPETNRGRTVNFSMSPVTIFPTDFILSVDATDGPITLYLPDVANVPAFKQYVIKDSAGISATHHILISCEPETIDGSSSFIISTNYQSVSLFTDGTNWFIF